MRTIGVQISDCSSPLTNHSASSSEKYGQKENTTLTAADPNRPISISLGAGSRSASRPENTCPAA